MSDTRSTLISPHNNQKRLSERGPRQEIEWIALYGSLMRGLGAMDEIDLRDGLEFHGRAVIPGELFDLGDYPGLRPHAAGRVQGELYRILDTRILIELDSFEGVFPNRPTESLYLRERTLLLQPAGVETWIYFYNRVPEPENRIASGDWRGYLEVRSGS